MQPMFYHDRPEGSGQRARRFIGALAVGSVLAAACAQPANTPAPGGAPPRTTAPSPASRPSESSGLIPAPTPTSTAIADGRAAIEKVRAAAGGPALTALRSFEISGSATMNSLKIIRQLNVLAMFPHYYRQDEGPLQGATGPTFRTIVGLEGTVGWLAGARLGGEGASRDLAVAQRAYTRAARQAMVGFVAGINAPWLVDSGTYTATIGGTVDAGPDQGAITVWLDGPDGRAGRLVIDPDTLLPRRLIEPPQPGGGQAAVADLVFTYSDYQPQAGLQLPHTIVRENGRNRTVWSITKYSLNPRLTPRRFTQSGR